MTDAAVQEALEDLFSALEDLETQTGAILQFLKERRIASDKGLAPFLEKAVKARWRATRIRFNRLLSSASQANEIFQEKSPPVTEARKDQQAVQQPSEERRHVEEVQENSRKFRNRTRQ